MAEVPEETRSFEEVLEAVEGLARSDALLRDIFLSKKEEPEEHPE